MTDLLWLSLFTLTARLVPNGRFVATDQRKNQVRVFMKTILTYSDRRIHTAASTLRPRCRLQPLQIVRDATRHGRDRVFMRIRRSYHKCTLTEAGGIDV